MPTFTIYTAEQLQQMDAKEPPQSKRRPPAHSVFLPGSDFKEAARLAYLEAPDDPRFANRRWMAAFRAAITAGAQPDEARKIADEVVSELS